ncbi:hypothetical protein N0V87_005979 [Didymella glomerata]|uniref:C2H2-type domain-containing protein n=1 Tax=Didymella glomerata TaxID=749621 RepID=A0A9W8WXE5_9PLEO|nr:hypothetical protein N0V87_005979 [Didymella glomerata]
MHLPTWTSAQDDLASNQHCQVPATYTALSSAPAPGNASSGGHGQAFPCHLGHGSVQTAGTEVAGVAFNVDPVVAEQALSILSQAVVLEIGDGRFLCSEPDCNASYQRKGDCQRHLKKHNGPFFYCDQRGCSMEFYRHDKLRAHMQQGHDIAIPPPGNKRRQRRGVTGQ